MATRNYTTMHSDYNGIFSLKKTIPLESIMIYSDDDVEIWEAIIETPGNSPNIPIYAYGFDSDGAFDNLEVTIIKSFDRHDNYHPSLRKGVSNSRLSSLNQYLQRVT